MSSRTNNVVITLLFEDDSTRNITFEDVTASDLPDVKHKIIAINENANNEYENFYKTFVSDDGAQVIQIAAAKIISIEEEVVYGD